MGPVARLTPNQPSGPGAADPWQIGLDHEGSATAEQRSKRGAWYTPRSLVESLVAAAIDSARPPSFVVDPTCGGGGFLLGSLDRFVTLGIDPADALTRIGGIDTERGAVEAARVAIGAWAQNHGVHTPADLDDRLVLGDSLDAWPAGWPPADLIIGNPPFATPLKGSFPPRASEARLDRAHVLGPYADLAAIHLAVNVERVSPGGRVCLVLPQSLLAGRDCVGLRRHLAEVAPLTYLWASAHAVFDAGVRVWAPVLLVGDSDVTGSGSSVTVATGRTPMVLGERATGSWSELAADAVGTPYVELDQTETLGSLATATAGFRDEFYGLAAACVEAEDDTDPRPRLTTVGSLDPLHCYWGERSLRIAKRDWLRPVVDTALLDERISEWLAQQLRPKVVLPTQSKVFEPFVDRAGHLAPLTPLVSIHASADQLDLVAAVLLAPPIVAWARRRWFGAAMSVEAIKLAAKDVAELPLPLDRGRWHRAAALVATVMTEGSANQQLTVLEVGRVMNQAYGADSAVFDWWASRLP